MLNQDILHPKFEKHQLIADAAILTRLRVVSDTQVAAQAAKPELYAEIAEALSDDQKSVTETSMPTSVQEPFLAETSDGPLPFSPQVIDGGLSSETVALNPDETRQEIDDIFSQENSNVA